MRTVLAVGLDETMLSAVEAELRHIDGVRLRASCEKEAITLASEGGIDAVLLGPAVEAPVRAAQRARAAGSRALVVVLSGPDRYEAITGALRFAPLIDDNVRSIPLDRPAVAAVEVRDAVVRERRRQAHQQTVAALNVKLADAPAVPRAAEVLGRLLDVAPIGVAVLDQHGLVRALNPKVGEILGVRERDLVAMPIGQLFPGETARWEEFMQNVSTEIAGARATFHREAGQRVEVTAARLTSSAREPGWLVVLEDVTERLRLLEELRAEEERAKAAYRAAREATRRKDEFLAMLGHELRNPLSPILTAVHLARRRGGAAERELGVIDRQVKHLVRLIDDLLDVSRITRGKIELKKEILDLASVVAKAVEMTSPLLEERRHTLTISVPRGRLWILGDSTRLSQVIANLLTNAAKYTDPGGRVEVSAEQEGGAIALCVRDSGIGIAPELLPVVFEPFVQEAQGIERAKGGLGLGLAIVKNLVELHDGRVEVQSQLGRGCEFKVVLPAHAGSAPEAQDHGKTGGREAAEGGGLETDTPRILVVDDNADAVTMLAELLQVLGYRTRTALDGPSALAVAHEFMPALALLDIGLPVMDGYELARHLRDALPDVRLVAITGYGQDADRRRTSEAGFDAHLVKPIELERLREIVVELASRSAIVGRR
jgi:PAS domain S-box-containing protein